ncbi:MAG: MgtC/SapB family protein, partial [Synergistes sp.]|nr:MgtC/SapB family protein [Synergistes sp.]
MSGNFTASGIAIQAIININGKYKTEVTEMLPDEMEILKRLLLAAFFGILFGIERRHRKKPVGARTHVLIALAAA